MIDDDYMIFFRSILFQLFEIKASGQGKVFLACSDNSLWFLMQ